MYIYLGEPGKDFHINDRLDIKSSTGKWHEAIITSV